MFHRTYRHWRGSLGSPVVKSAAKHLLPLMIAAALCLPGAPVAVTAAEVTPQEPPALSSFHAVSDSVTACAVAADGARLVSQTAQELDTAPPPPQEHHATGFIAPPMDLSYLTAEGLPGRLSASDCITETFDWRDRGGV